MPSKRAEKIVTVTVTPESMKPKVAMMEERVRSLQEYWSKAITMAEVESRVVLAREELEKINEEIHSSGSQAAELLAEAQAKMAEDRRAFERACAAQKRAMEDLSAEFNAQMASRSASIITQERDLEHRQKEVASVEAELRSRETQLSGREAGLALRETNLAESERTYRIQAARVAEMIRELEEKSRVLERSAAEVRDQKEWIQSADQEIKERTASLKQMALEVEKAKKEAIRLKGQVADEAVALSVRIQGHRDSIDALVQEKHKLSEAQNEVAQREMRARENDRKQAEREARILKLEATIREDERRLEYAKEQVRQDFVKLENAKRSA